MVSVTVSWPATALSHLGCDGGPQRPVEHAGNDPALYRCRVWASLKEAVLVSLEPKGLFLRDLVGEPRLREDVARSA